MVARNYKGSPDTANVRLVNVNAIEPHPQNPRGDDSIVDEAEMVDSLGRHGLIQPLVVRKLRGTREDRFQLIAGERRFRAVQKAGWTNVAVVVYECNDAEALAKMMAENLHRRDLNPIEKARGLVQLCKPIEDGGAGKTQAQAAAMFGHDQPWVSNLIRLLALPDAWQAKIISAEISECQARELLRYKDEPAILSACAADIEANPWAWRNAEDFQRNLTLLAQRSPAVTKAGRRSDIAKNRSGAKARESTGNGHAKAEALCPVVAVTVLEDEEPAAAPSQQSGPPGTLGIALAADEWDALMVLGKRLDAYPTPKDVIQYMVRVLTAGVAKPSSWEGSLVESLFPAPTAPTPIRKRKPR